MAQQSAPGTFIPRDTAVTKRRGNGGGLNDLTLLLAIVLVVASGALAVGVFFYGKLMQAESTSKAQQLQRAQAAFEPSLIQQITRLDDRMHVGDTLLSKHIAPTAFFAALGAATLETVSFKSLDYEEGDSQHITVKMQGVAQSVNSIALQANYFSKNGVITNPIFSNIARQADGVHFDLVANVNPIAVNFVTLSASSQFGAQGAAAAQSVSGSPDSSSSSSAGQSGATPASPFGSPDDASTSQ